MSELLNPFTLPLEGSRLIEASAGTGKTWTIAALYLRLVLGHDCARPFTPAEILVMTFTKAATRELSDRIRQRLVEAASCFRGESQPHPDDRFLSELLAAYPGTPEEPHGGARAMAAWRLAMAAEAMDDASVHTIDAWCQRMLREHAFDSGCLFDEELEANQTLKLAEAVRDYWRQHIYPLTGDNLLTCLDVWPALTDLQKSVKDILDKPLPDGAGGGSLENCIAAAIAARAAAIARLKDGWADRCALMQGWLEPLWARKDKPINGKALGPANGTRWIAALSEWATDPGIEVPNLGAGLAKLTREGVLSAINPNFSLDPPACFTEFAALVVGLEKLPAVLPAMRIHAAASIAGRLKQIKAQTGTFGFADMLDRFNRALDVTGAGDRAVRLRDRVLQQYPVALIDEFQDTSPIQLSIFNRLYRVADNDPARTILFIADPKQAIYGFRGADIQSYLSARRATAGRHYNLAVNHRSVTSLVTAVNGLFQHAEARTGEGAFMFTPHPAPGQTTPTASDVPFFNVGAKGRKERFVVADADVQPVILCLDTELLSKQDSRTRLSSVCAERIVELLNEPTTGFRADGEPFQRLRPADIAVLVRSGTEAAAVQSALRRCGVASVYLSDKDSVLGSAEAADVLRLLRAVASPRDTRLARAALATSLVGLSMPELLRLSTDDEHFDARCELLSQLRAVWEGQGVLAMLRKALHGFSLPARWLSPSSQSNVGDGERRLTNVLHLAELLQVQSAHLDGARALIRWLADQVQAAVEGQGGNAADEQVLRLESDADLVKIVTLHKSKGLEYPVVLIPFAAHFRPVERKGTSFVFLADEHGQRQLVLEPTDEQLAAADRERQREDLRLLYVALTRARHNLWIGLSALKSGNSKQCVWARSAIGYVMSGAGDKTPAELEADARQICSSVPGLTLGNVPVADPAQPPVVTRLTVPPFIHPLDATPPPLGSFDRQWGISSYSALVRDAGRSYAPSPAAAVADPLDQGMQTRVIRDDEPLDSEPHPSRGPSRQVSDQPWHRFPRGSFSGNFLHKQLEWLCAEGFALDASEHLQTALTRRCNRQGWGHRSEDVIAWLRAVCASPFRQHPSGSLLTLAGLPQVKAEMEFWFSINAFQVRAVDQLCRHHILPGRPRPELGERVLHGMLMGFIDLVFEHEGAYGVLDFKSNSLGVQDADYTLEAMEAAMLEHRYDVQAALYLLALHRLLRSRLGSDYVPRQNLDGATYYFLRGVGSPSGSCFHLPAPLELIERLDAMLTLSPTALDAAQPGVTA